MKVETVSTFSQLKVETMWHRIKIIIRFKIIIRKTLEKSGQNSINKHLKLRHTYYNKIQLDTIRCASKFKTAMCFSDYLKVVNMAPESSNFI